MQFGVFDHLDLGGGAAPARHYENRLKLIEAYDRARDAQLSSGRAPCNAARHGALPQRVPRRGGAAHAGRLRFGPLVYTLSLHHPLRVAEEICMLDQMSGGKLELGVGRGVVAADEVAYYGVDPAKGDAGNVRGGAAGHPGRVLSSQLAQGYSGEHFEVPRRADRARSPCSGRIPHCGTAWHGPRACPGWSPTASTSCATARRQWCTRSLTATGAAGRRRGAAPTRLPLMGMTRTIVVADSDAEALAIARRAYRRWRQSSCSCGTSTRPADQRLPPRQLRRRAAGGHRHRRHAGNGARRARAPRSPRRGSTISSAASPSATWRRPNRSPRSSCSPRP